ncbi:MAG: transporter substrate-binding domain-containing protein [Atopobiaceae bacterium]|jgi:putative lysine transport system substrate-binding protein|nr:transporter substrate-binding domain-containing protein [Olegusella sp.]
MKDERLIGKQQIGNEATTKAVDGLKTSRRSFFKVSGLAALTLGGMTFLTACGPAAEGTSSGSSSTNTGSSSSSSSSFAADGTMRVGMEAAYAPYNWQVSEESDYTIPIENVDGAYADGYDIQFAKKIGEALSVSPVAVKMSFDGLVDACKNGQIDIICAGMTATDERRKSIDFSDPYIEDTISVVTKSDSKYASATSLDDLAGAAVMGQQSTFYDDVIDQIPDVNHLTPREYVPDVVSALESGEADAITYSTYSAPKLLESYPDLVVCPITDGFTGDEAKNDANVGIAKGQDDILDEINKAIDAVSDEERTTIWDACMDRQPQ